MDLYDEIKSEQQKENLSNEQVAILDDYIKQLTYKEIKTKHKLSCHNVIVRVVIRTIQLQYWVVNSKVEMIFIYVKRTPKDFTNIFVIIHMTSIV